MINKIKLDYDISKFLTADYTQHEGSCISHQVHELTDIHEKYGGFPKTYIYENTLIHQLWWDKSQINFGELGKQLGMEVITVSTILQPPGCIIPLHRDTFFQIFNLIILSNCCDLCNIIFINKIKNKEIKKKYNSLIKKRSYFTITPLYKNDDTKYYFTYFATKSSITPVKFGVPISSRS